MTFQSSVIVIAEVILFISILIIGINLYKQKANLAYPPIIADCPDYWEINGTMCHKPKNNSLVTDCPNQDFGSPMYKGSTGLCEKQKWSKLCKVTWDGITNNNDLCH